MAAMRILYDVNRRQYPGSLLVDLHWLDIKSRIDFNIILLTFKAIHEQVLAYICELGNIKFKLRAQIEQQDAPLNT